MIKHARWRTWPGTPARAPRRWHGCVTPGMVSTAPSRAARPRGRHPTSTGYAPAPYGAARPAADAPRSPARLHRACRRPNGASRGAVQRSPVDVMEEILRVRAAAGRRGEPPTHCSRAPSISGGRPRRYSAASRGACRLPDRRRRDAPLGSATRHQTRLPTERVRRRHDDRRRPTPARSPATRRRTRRSSARATLPVRAGRASTRASIRETSHPTRPTRARAAARDDDRR